MADHSTTSPPPPPVTLATHTPKLQLQADKIESSIQDTNNRLSSIYASISMLAKNFGASSSEQRQLQFPSHPVSLDTTNPPLPHAFLLMMMSTCSLMQNHHFLINPLRYPPIYPFLNPH